MISKGLAEFAGKHVLLLQGPIGPFFWRLAKDLRQAGAHVSKINFNGGDSVFYPLQSTAYRGSLEGWPQYLRCFIQEHNVDVVLLFGDCRPIHLAAKTVVTELQRELGVFEEGYVRPDYITFERSGVNGHSSLPRNPLWYKTQPHAKVPATVHVGNTFRPAIGWACAYYLAGCLGKPFYGQYQHHRPLHIMEAWPWVRSAFRKWRYKQEEAPILPLLTSQLSGKYFLVPLQVHNDAQISTHSNYQSVEHFIQEVMRSFADHATGTARLVIKHHPMDRGYHDYAPLITRLAQEYGIQGRVFYIHDQHLPTLLDHSRGVVLINSTVGLQALHHMKPLKVCGDALYDMPGLTYQGDLDSFWTMAENFTVDSDLYQRFKDHLIATTQFNGSFYKRCAGHAATGLRYAKEDGDLENAAQKASPLVKA